MGIIRRFFIISLIIQLSINLGNIILAVRNDYGRPFVSFFYNNISVLSKRSKAIFFAPPSKDLIYICTVYCYEEFRVL